MKTLLTCMILVVLAYGNSASGAEITGENISTRDEGNVPLISVLGDLLESDVLRFEELVGQTTGRAVVIFDSKGGSLEAGIEIGRAIQRAGYATAVTGTCASACALAWLGGRKRFASDEARIGFHVAYINNELVSVSGTGNALVGHYLGQLGMQPNVVRYVTSAPPEGMQWLSFRDAALLGIDVERLDGTQDTAKDPENPNAPVAGLDPLNSKRAFKNASDRYGKAGISGLKESSIECWKVVKKKRTLDSVQYCRVLDMLGMALDAAAQERFGKKAAVRYFGSKNRLNDLVDGIASTGISDPSVALQLSNRWQAEFEDEVAALSVDR